MQAPGTGARWHKAQPGRRSVCRGCESVSLALHAVPAAPPPHTWHPLPLPRRTLSRQTPRACPRRWCGRGGAGTPSSGRRGGRPNPCARGRPGRPRSPRRPPAGPESRGRSCSPRPLRAREVECGGCTDCVAEIGRRPDSCLHHHARSPGTPDGVPADLSPPLSRGPTPGRSKPRPGVSTHRVVRRAWVGTASRLPWLPCAGRGSRAAPAPFATGSSSDHTPAPRPAAPQSTCASDALCQEVQEGGGGCAGAAAEPCPPWSGSGGGPMWGPMRAGPRAGPSPGPVCWAPNRAPQQLGVQQFLHACRWIRRQCRVHGHCEVHHTLGEGAITHRACSPGGQPLPHSRGCCPTATRASPFCVPALEPSAMALPLGKASNVTRCCLAAGAHRLSPGGPAEHIGTADGVCCGGWAKPAAGQRTAPPPAPAECAIGLQKM